MPYCSRSDLFAFGVPRGATPNPGRVLSDLTSSLCTLDVHGFSTGDAVLFRAAGAGALPPELSADVTYYAQSESENTFRVRATPTGSALSITTATDPVMAISPIDFDAAIAWAGALINDSLPAHIVPITGTVPEIVRMSCAELAAGKVLSVMGAASVSLSATVDAAIARLAKWAKGIPLRVDAPPPANLSVSATSDRPDRRGWGRYGGL